MIRVAIVAAVVVAALVASRVVGSRRTKGPTQVGYVVPTQLDRADFSRPEAPWLVVAFTSATCSTCADIQRKVVVLESNMVAVEVAEYGARRDLHDKYGVDAVPSVVFVDTDGVVQASFVGPVSATDLWAGLARVRDGGEAGGCDEESVAH
jgi:hypothetical protein